jgi:hypothetical protein
MLFFVNCFALLCLLGRAQFYPSVPSPYCTYDINTRDIPPLSASQAAQVSNLIQVQNVIRHGARTIANPPFCWMNYDVTWNDCNVTDMMLGSNSYTSQNVPANWIFRKLYDGSPNELGGNCATGQLISEGYDMEVGLGQVIQRAYFGNGSATSNSNLLLFPNNSWDSINASRIWLRADDITRTLMSAQLVMESLFNRTTSSNNDPATITEIIPIHTGDLSLDQINPNTEVCPRLNDCLEASGSSEEFMAHIYSPSFIDTTEQLSALFGPFGSFWNWENNGDCLWSTCEDGSDVW